MFKNVLWMNSKKMNYMYKGGGEDKQFLTVKC
jgi:hypothetical protein